MFDYKSVKAELSTLNQAASVIDGQHDDQTEQFIRVGEYCLALDSIAYSYLDNNIDMPSDLFQIFEKLAVALDVEGDEEYQGVARLRAAARARPA